uniref:Uncharacterized protein n=1 Tax=Arundo donax TaxID=35708 RepID=A0A0A9A4L9_ARUDO
MLNDRTVCLIKFLSSLQFFFFLVEFSWYILCKLVHNGGRIRQSEVRWR